jgi:hypothetical protein
MDIPDEGMIQGLGRRGTEQDAVRFFHTTWNGLQLKTCALFTLKISHLIFLDPFNIFDHRELKPGRPKPWIKEDLCISVFFLHVCNIFSLQVWSSGTTLSSPFFTLTIYLKHSYSI